MPWGGSLWGPYLEFEPEFGLVVEDDQGVCGYALGALDSKRFYLRYETEWRPALCERFPLPSGDPAHWSRVQHVHSWYHRPDYFCPEPYDLYPSHLHIDFLERAQGKGLGRTMLQQVMASLRSKGSPGAHLGVSLVNEAATGFYRHLGFRDLVQVGSGTEGCLYMGMRFS